MDVATSQAAGAKVRPLPSAESCVVFAIGRGATPMVLLSTYDSRGNFENDSEEALPSSLAQ